MVIFLSGGKTCGTVNDNISQFSVESSKRIEAVDTDDFIPIPTAAALGLLPKRVVGRESFKQERVLGSW